MAGILRNQHPVADQVWHVQIVVVVAILLQIALPNIFSETARYLIPAIEALLLVALAFTTPRERVFKSFTRRLNALLLIGIVTFANGYALGVVADKLLKGGHIANGRTLLLSAINIYLTNIIIFALWYWEMDGGGPGERQRVERYNQDFL